MILSIEELGQMSIADFKWELIRMQEYFVHVYNENKLGSKREALSILSYYKKIISSEANPALKEIIQHKNNRIPLSDKGPKENTIGTRIFYVIESILSFLLLYFPGDDTISIGLFYLDSDDPLIISANHNISTSKKTGGKKSSVYETFKDLFRFPYYEDKSIKLLKEILQENKYLDSNNNWIGLTNRAKEFAAFIHQFIELKVMLSGDIGPKAIGLGKQFGIIIGDSGMKEKKWTTRTFTDDPLEIDGRDGIREVLTDWKNKVNKVSTST